MARHRNVEHRGAKGRERGGHGALADLLVSPLPWTPGGAVPSRGGISSAPPGRAVAARGCGFARGGRGWWSRSQAGLTN